VSEVGHHLHQLQFGDREMVAVANEMVVEQLVLDAEFVMLFDWRQ
jgi:hypothetical protein